MFDIDSYNRELEAIFTMFPSYQKVGKLAYKPGLDSMKDFDDKLGIPIVNSKQYILPVLTVKVPFPI